MALNKKLKLFIFLILQFFIFSLNAQEKDEAQIKKQIEKLYLKKDIKGINLLINKNTFLDPEYALSALYKNIQLAQNEKDKENLLISTYLTLGSFWARQGNKTKAYESFVLGENYSRRINDQKRLGLLLGQANIIDEIPLKIEKYNEVIQILEEQKDTLNLIRTHLNLGFVYTSKFLNEKIPQKSNKDSAFSQYNQAQKLNRLFGNKEMTALLKYRKAEWELYYKNYSKASELLIESENLFTDLGLIQWKIYCLLT